MELEELLSYAPFIRVQLTGPTSAIIYVWKSKEYLLQNAIAKLLAKYKGMYVEKLGYTPKHAIYYISLIEEYKE